MIKNYLLIGIRNLRKQKFYSTINIIGLAVGISCCILIMLYVVDELSYDRYNPNSDRVYRIGFDGQLGENAFRIAQTGAPLALGMVNDFPEVEWATRIYDQGSFIVKAGENIFKEERVLFADSSVFKTFGLNLVKGNPVNALSMPKSIVLTQNLAEKYFPDLEPIGQFIGLDNQNDYVITGIMEEIPPNTHFKADMFISMESLEQSREMDGWTSFNFQTYAVLKKNTDPKLVDAKFRGMVVKYIGPQIEQYMGVSIKEFEDQGNRMAFFMDPVTSIHLYNSLPGELGVASDIKYVYIFSAIALFILLIASINFMNLSTAKSATRAKEVGVRKALGSRRNQLIGQFLNESVFLSVLSFAIAILLASLVLPYYNSLAGKELVIPFDSPLFYLEIVAGILAVGLLAGSYPAFFLSAFSASSILKGNLNLGMKSSKLRSLLVVFQFSTSIILVSATIVIYDQLSYIQNKKLGFNRDHVLILNDTYLLGDKIEGLKEKLLGYPEVINATVSGFLPVNSSSSTNSFFPKGTSSAENLRIINIFQVDNNYIPTMGIELAEGRNFDPEYVTDSSAIIVNEALVRLFNLNEPLGTILTRPSDDPNVSEDYKIIGVVKDFHFQSLRENIRPMLFQLRKNTGMISLKIQTSNLPELISKIEKEWDLISQGQPFAYSFLDDRFTEMYKQEHKAGKIAVIFSSLAILIACLGLFGLAAFTAEQKTKEIGIRKVMGASIGNILLLLSKEFSRLILIAIVIATPLAWYFMERWLSEFTYRIILNPVIFLGAGIIALCIAWISISYQSYKAASSNPVNSLRNE